MRIFAWLQIYVDTFPANNSLALPRLGHMSVSFQAHMLNHHAQHPPTHSTTHPPITFVTAAVCVSQRSTVVKVTQRFMDALSSTTIQSHHQQETFAAHIKCAQAANTSRVATLKTLNTVHGVSCAT